MAQLEIPGYELLRISECLAALSCRASEADSDVGVKRIEDVSAMQIVRRHLVEEGRLYRIQVAFPEQGAVKERHRRRGFRIAATRQEDIFLHPVHSAGFGIPLIRELTIAIEMR